MWHNFFDPSPLLKQLFSPPFRQLNVFGPLHFAQPPHQGISEHSLTLGLNTNVENK